MKTFGGRMQHHCRPFQTFLAASALAALAGCAGGNSAGGGTAADAPVLRVGDRWVYHAKDGFRVLTLWEETREVTAVGPDGITVRVTQKGPDIDTTRVERWASPGIVLTGALYDSETRRFATPLQRYDFPMVPGRTWNQFVDNFNESTKKDGQINRYVRVRGWDAVTTAAGTFDAIRLDILTRLDDDDFWRYATDCNYVLWYAPAARAMVRETKQAQYREKGDWDGGIAIRTQYTMLELAAFSPGAP
jgi:hypothetical protein